MVLILNPFAGEEEIRSLNRRIEEKALERAIFRGQVRTQIHVLGDLSGETEAAWRTLPGVEQVYGLAKPYRLANKTHRKASTRIGIGSQEIGSDDFVVVGGPCALESEEQGLEAAVMVQRLGLEVMRASAFKPRTSPYSFQGLGVEGLRILNRIRQRTGILVETEVMDVRDVGPAAELVDILRIGARNMQNFDLLKEFANVDAPVILKRGAANTIREFLLAAEYILRGNPNVILCERGIRTFETAYRNTLDVGAIAVLKQETHLPVIADPSHSAGNKTLVPALALASIAAGADGLLVEAHPDPAVALSDGDQSLYPYQFAALLDDLRRVGVALGRQLLPAPGAGGRHRVTGQAAAADTVVAAPVPGRRADYEIRIGEGALGALPALLDERFPRRRVAVVADAEAWRLHGDRLRARLPSGSVIVALASGEANKTRAEKTRVEDAFLDARLGRDSVVLGFGGGVATDLAGFVAATYLRGVPFVGLPTTLLAAVDASVGGKTGVNTRHGKNLIGAIRAPAGVFVDTSLFDTLPDAEFRNGIAEAVKMAATSDAEMFRRLERERGLVLRRDRRAVRELIVGSLRIKVAVTAVDEREAGLRSILNFGHTIGHGLEAASGYRLPHGAAVAIGMVAEARMARNLDPPLAAAAERRLATLLRDFGLPVAAPPGIRREAVVAALVGDKKSRRGEPRFVILSEIGDVRRTAPTGGESGFAHPLPRHAMDAGLGAIGL